MIGRVRVDIERSGGVAGLIRRADVDTTDLDAGVARQAEAALTALAGDRQAPPQAPGSQRPDAFQYTFRFRDGAGLDQTVVVGESRLPAALRPLTEQITARRPRA
ncbi:MULTISPECIES: protealysin inhibitor emfourin [unclassified Frankia]|uniref:protealysin inhibitor emfourin n=1 Tax=unclassified Frankia TaxID=2632575 RepID=UPI000B210BD6|nr:MULTISPECIES: protealysin inhibitor emfourin [unclassified Frankia]